MWKHPKEKFTCLLNLRDSPKKKFKLKELDSFEGDEREHPGQLFTIGNKKLLEYMGAPIEVVYIDFDDSDLVVQISVLIKDEEVLTEKLTDAIYDKFGETFCARSVNYDRPPFYCTWEDGEHEIIVSNMESPGMGPGNYVHIVFIE